MTAIKSLLNELRYEMLKVILIEAFLDATIFFLCTLLVVSIFGIGPMIPLGASILFLIIDIIIRMRRISMKYIEDRNPDIKEMLRTAADNSDEETLMAHALFTDLIERMRQVSSGSFFNFKQTSMKIVAVFAFSIILVSLAFFNVNLQKFENPLASAEDQFNRFFDGLFGDTGPDVAIGDADDELFGDPSIARLGDDALDITIEQSLSRIDFNEVNAADPSAEVPDSYPVDVSATASEAYTAGLSDINDRKTAAEYSQQVK